MKIKTYNEIKEILLNTNLNISFDYEDDDFKGFKCLDTNSTFRINFKSVDNKEIEYDNHKDNIIEYGYLNDYAIHLNNWIDSIK